ncbi:Protein of uncharacterised function (DUF499) [Rothia aeria]|uniref:Protein of uncharacterized function (DUF499) n=1 Tax=Rothia aeria TaxID=172042 RepID=A0A7Z9A339_9MICC|nr:DUF499 domain-containing protein [Rothia aeria]VEI22671.1 Protein of uncharacterised function (DUF499) [Rothia aeria]
MAINNRDRIGKALDLLAEGLHDTVDEVMTEVYGTSDWNIAWATEDERRSRDGKTRNYVKTDLQVQLRAITENGREFNDVISRSQQAYASELRETRNQWAHNGSFSSEDTVRALDTMERLLRVVHAVDSADDVRKIRIDLQRTFYEDQTRKQAKRVSQISLSSNTGLPSWREIIQPHDDVAGGKFTASEFAADLHLVHTNQALSPEYGDPVEFFKRTYLTEGLRDLLGRALRRLNGDNSASPVINLQTNFGGGKTHSMLALYHLFSGTPAQQLPQEITELIAANNNPDLSTIGVKRVVLVGTYLKAGSPIIKQDGTEVHTLWGELAWQLGGREAYELVAADDKAGTSPGEALHTVLKKYSPAIILIDEWVAYARQLVDKELSAGSFETQFTFAQSLTEIVSSIPGAMLIVSIPASDNNAEAAGSDIEIGGANGKLALDRLQNVIRRVADQWRPSSKNESFEIVRRRLFQIPDNKEKLTTIAAVARTFVTLYRDNPTLFPREAAASSNDYEKRIRASYPLHPELLDRLYEDWSTLERFQRTRGVLKLVSSIVHELWTSNDDSPLILPGNVPLSATTVNTDLTQYLEDQWKPIIDSDIDGQGSTAQRIDKERPALGQRAITQRLARSIFVGAAPRVRSTHKGLDKQYLWLGTAVPGDTLGNFGTAIEMLSQKSTYFYEEQGHYWFDTQPSVNKVANDYAERLREDNETVWNEIIRRLRAEERNRKVFGRVHVAPETSTEIPDAEDTRLVIVHPRYARHKKDDAESPAHRWVRQIIESKGSSPRIHRNTLIFLMADRGELEKLEAVTRSYLGWQNVHSTGESLNLSAQQSKQANDWVNRLDQTVTDRIRDTFIWAMYPQQLDPASQFEIVAEKVPGSGIDSLTERVGKKLGREGQLITTFGAQVLGTILHQELKSLWDKSGEISVGELWGYFTRYIYMPRLINRDVLDEAVKQALSTVFLEGEKFAIATGKETGTNRYLGIIIPPNAHATIQVTDGTLLINAELAQTQEAGEVAAPAILEPAQQALARDGESASGVYRSEVITKEETPAAINSFTGTVNIAAEQYSRTINNITHEVIARLINTGALVEVSVAVQAIKPEGFTDAEMRIITENTRVLRFDPETGFYRISE